MKNNFKILVATDFSPASGVLLGFLKKLASKISCNFYFIHVIPSFWKNWISSGLLKKESFQRLENYQNKLIDAKNPKRLLIEIGNRPDNILSQAKSLNVDLIAVGAKTNKNGRHHSGTTVKSIARNAKKSVIICKNESISNIICGIDGSKASGKALNWAIFLAKHFDCKLTILHIMTKIDGITLGMEDEDINRLTDDIEKKTKSEIMSFLKNYEFSDLSYELTYLWGNPSSVILNNIEDNNHDLVVIGAKGHSILHEVLIGSTAEKILEFLPCSLLITR